MSASKPEMCTEEGDDDTKEDGDDLNGDGDDEESAVELKLAPPNVRNGDGDDEESAVELKMAQPNVRHPCKEVATVKLKWILLCISSHLTWGLYPVFARYLQVTRGLDGLLIIAFSFTCSFLVVQMCTCAGLGGLAGARVGSVYSLITLGRATTNMLSSKFTLALYTQLITQLGPFVVALLSRLFLQEAIPRCFLPALTLSTTGAMLTIVGLAETNSAGFDYVHAFGIGLSVVSVMFSAGMRIFMKTSSTSLSEHELISWQFTNAVPLVILASMTKTSSGWEHVLDFSMHDVLVVLAFAFVITLFANLSQVATVRHLGPTLASSLQPFRLVSTVAGGYIVLGECACSALVWSGLFIITSVLSVYLCAQRKKSSALADVTGKGSKDCRTTMYGRVERC